MAILARAGTGVAAAIDQILQPRWIWPPSLARAGSANFLCDTAFLVAANASKSTFGTSVRGLDRMGSYRKGTSHETHSPLLLDFANTSMHHLFYRWICILHHLDQDGIKQAAQDKISAHNSWEYDQKVLREDLDICDKIYDARDKLLGAAGLPVDPDTELDLETGNRIDGDPLDRNSKQDKLIGLLHK